MVGTNGCSTGDQMCSQSLRGVSVQLLGTWAGTSSCNMQNAPGRWDALEPVWWLLSCLWCSAHQAEQPTGPARAFCGFLSRINVSEARAKDSSPRGVKIVPPWWEMELQCVKYLQGEQSCQWVWSVPGVLGLCALPVTVTVWEATVTRGCCPGPPASLCIRRGQWPITKGLPRCIPASSAPQPCAEPARGRNLLQPPSCCGSCGSALCPSVHPPALHPGRLRDQKPFPSAVFWTTSFQLAPLPTLSLSAPPADCRIT